MIIMTFGGPKTSLHGKTLRKNWLTSCRAIWILYLEIDWRANEPLERDLDINWRADELSKLYTLESTDEPTSHLNEIGLQKVALYSVVKPNFFLRFLQFTVFPWCKDRPHIVMFWWEWLGRFKWRATGLDTSVWFFSTSRWCSWN